jgi:PAS domain S-box-containing protein
MTTAPTFRITVNLTGEYTSLPPRYARLLGYDVEHFRGLSVYDLLHEDDKPIVGGVNMAMLAGEIDEWHGKFRIRASDGIYMWVESLVRRTAEGFSTVARIHGRANPLQDMTLPAVCLTQGSPAASPYVVVGVDEDGVLFVAYSPGISYRMFWQLVGRALPPGHQGVLRIMGDMPYLLDSNEIHLDRELLEFGPRLQERYELD